MNPNLKRVLVPCLIASLALGLFYTIKIRRNPVVDKATLSDADLMFYEGIRRGYAMDDLIVRRELVKRVRDAVMQEHPQAEPTDDDLNAYLQQHADQYQFAAHYSFDQVYLSRGTHGTHMAADAAELKSKLQTQAENFGAMGDPFPHGHHLEHLTPMQIEAIFGNAIAQGISALAPRQWQGPLESPLGIHFVRVTAVEPGRTLTLAEARSRLRVDYLLEQQRKILRDELVRLRKNFSGAAALPKPATFDEDTP